MSDINFYTSEELVSLWTTFDRLMRGPLRGYVEAYRLTLCVGLREFETAGIEVENCHENYIQIRQGKGGKDRVADLLPVCLPYYHTYLRERQCSASMGARWLFPSPKFEDQHVSTRALRKWWRVVVQEAGIRYFDKLPLHALRSTFATWAAEQLSEVDLMRQLGHAKLDTTLKHYQGSLPGRKFSKPTPEWIKVAVAGGQALLESQNVIELAARRMV